MKALAALAVFLVASPSSAEDVAWPKPHQVIQRTGFDPAVAKNEQPGHWSYGWADVPVKFASSADAPWEYRVVKLAGATGAEVPWTLLASDSARIPAGGWYRLELRSPGKGVREAAVEPIGVGEVFLVAGQSYATNCNDKLFQVADASKRVSAFDAAKGTWRVANDPQPVADTSNGGSIWPPVGDALVKSLRVPVGFANVAWGGSSSRQWMPGEPHYKRLSDTGVTLGRFRAVLWQQGESDVIEKSSTEKYVANVRAIRHASAAKWGTNPPWLLAKSTLHPTVYNDPAGEGRIRKGIDELAERPGFRMGPDTDTLAGENRGDAKSRRHFSAIGQENAAKMWVDSISKLLASPPSTMEMLPDLHLLEPAWASETVHRESTILLREKADGFDTARLAFPAAEVLAVATAEGRHRFDPDAYSSGDGLSFNFVRPDPVASINTKQMFPPKGSPMSYASRVGHPEQNLMYHPGVWFHERNIEITYRRKDKPAELERVGSLPKTAARLKAGESFTIGVSGDSISTGLDASAKVNAPPHQPGYPDLVVAQLQAKFDSKIALVNRAVAGWSVANGVKDLDKLLESKPHLVIVAYGMNDVGRRDPKWYGEQTKAIVDGIRKANPDAEIILVSSMLGNAEWTATPRAMFGPYRDELKKLCGPGIALADLTAVWEIMLKHKHDLDLTGNGLNHPNDFGHRLYAQAVLSLLK
jgi:acyl-CoA thioesterase-1